MKTLKLLSFVVILAFTLYSFTSIIDQDPWVVPDKYKTMKNPTDKANKDNLMLGKSLYNKHCKSCHGKEGLGDGTKADEVEGDLGDFSSEEFQSQTDGELFYKSYFGRDDMPNYEKKIPKKEEMWYVINYLRTLKQ